MKKIGILLAAAIAGAAVFTGCGSAESAAVSSAESAAVSTAASASEVSDAALADGVYTATFTTDSSMFHVNEAYSDQGILTVDGGEMTIHIVLTSTKIVNLYPGKAEDAQQEGAELLQPTVETVEYSDGTTDEANAFDVPVPAIGEDFDLALIGTKGVWYDHVVSVSDPVPMEES
ncbi:MAG: hypothetical protein Q4B15_03495 [Lachnospiraceae bacterium]|nr:hypothetical protein [Lachnospiraceae bacterium]